MSSHTRTHSDPDRISLWVVLFLGLLVLALAVATRAEDLPSRASRTQTFNATGKIRSLSVENINGDVSVSAGPHFSASVEVTARARTQDLAKKTLDETTVSFENHDGELTLVTEEPGSHIRRSGRRWDLRMRHDDGESHVEARYAITLPPDAELNVSAVNGNVSARGISASTEISTVNGNAEVDGARRDVSVRSVNGNITASCAEVARGAHVSSETVNGNIKLRLPSSARFEFSGHTMSGEIVTTFPLPPAENAERRTQRDEARAERDRLRAEQEKLRSEMREREKTRRSQDGEVDVEVDLSGLNEAMAELGREMGRMGEEIARSVTENLNRAYTGTVNGGGASVKCSTLNGRIALLAAGSDESKAKSLVGRRSGPHPPAVPHPAAFDHPPAPPRPPRPPRPPAGGEEDASITRGDVAGDFEVTLPFGDVQVGKVAGSVRINTHGGEISVQEAGKTADLTSSGGEIRIESARGDLKCLTYGGDVTVGSVAGSATLRTVGGDISLRSGGGAVVAKTGGGDITLAHVRGPLTAETGGGNVTCEIFSREAAGAASIVSGAGDVVVTLPANYRADVDISVCGVDSEEDYISSQFPEIAVSKKGSRTHGTQTASGKLNGGGPRVLIRTSSGRVTLKKGPPA